MPRPRTPTNILKLRGADKHDPARLKKRENEPKPKRGTVTAPRWLSVRGKKAFRELSKITDNMKVLTVADGTSLAMVCDAFADYQEFGSLVETNGATYTIINQQGEEMIKPNPAVNMKADAWRRVILGLGKFGLTPSERSNVEVISELKKNPFADDWD